MKIVTSFDYPPIPVRDCDWSAVTDNFDADCDEGRWVANESIGRGATEQEAIANLIEQLVEGEHYTALECESARDVHNAIKQAKVWDQVLDRLFGGAR